MNLLRQMVLLIAPFRHLQHLKRWSVVLWAVSLLDLPSLCWLFEACHEGYAEKVAQYLTWWKSARDAHKNGSEFFGGGGGLAICHSVTDGE